MTPHILQKIVAAKQEEVALLLEEPVIASVQRRDFVGALMRPDRRSIIAEIKPKSPSQGAIFPRSSIPSIVEAYNTSADAISVLCDEEFFGGGYDLLREVRSMTDKPILAKEFIIDPKQIRYAASQGADAVLLIAAILNGAQLREFATEASTLGLGCLIEVHSDEDVKKVAETYEKLPQIVLQQVLIGINNRDLDTLEVDLSVTERLAPIIRKTMPEIRGIIAESGIGAPEDVGRLRKHVQGFLIGTSVLRSANPARFLDSLLASKTAVKFCGMTNSEDLVAAEKLNVDFVGFIFVPSSPRHINLEDARKLRKSIKHAKTVGVFVDMSKEDIERHIDALRLDYVQLHGKPYIELCRAISVPVIQAFRGVPSIETLEKFLAVCPYVLVDKEDGKEEADFQAISFLPAHIRSRVFLAGGLNPENVREAASMVHPFAVDCARGIEAVLGKKDKELMTSFLTALTA